MLRYSKIIKEKGIKMTWIAQNIGVPKSTLSNYLSGKREIPSDIEFKLNKILSI